MDYALDRSEQQVRDAIIATDKVPAALIELTEPKPNIPADLALPTFRAAKELKLPPPQLAQELAAEAVEAAGAGALERAVELMEQAFVLAPDLRQQYWLDLARWRRGVIW